MNNAFTDDIKSDLWSVMLYDDRNFFTNHLFGESRTEKVIENQWDVMQIKLKMLCIYPYVCLQAYRSWVIQEIQEYCRILGELGNRWERFLLQLNACTLLQNRKLRQIILFCDDICRFLHKINLMMLWKEVAAG